MENTTKNDIVKNEESVTEVEMNKGNSQSPVDASIEFNSPPVDALIGFKEETEEKMEQFKKRVKEGVGVVNQVLKEQERNISKLLPVAVLLQIQYKEDKKKILNHQSMLYQWILRL